MITVIYSLLTTHTIILKNTEVTALSVIVKKSL
jgi:hypothetical protein